MGRLRLANQVIVSVLPSLRSAATALRFAVRREAIASLRIACRASPTIIALTRIAAAGRLVLAGVLWRLP